MEQTFHDLYKERNGQSGHWFFLLAIFTETAIGIVREYLLILMQGDVMKTVLTNPRAAAFISFILALPLGLTYVIFMVDIEPLTNLLDRVFTIDGQQEQINMLGRIVLFGGLLLLPVAFAVNFPPLLNKDGPDGKRRLYVLNMIVGAIMFLLILFIWGGLILEEIYCFQGIRCD